MQAADDDDGLCLLCCALPRNVRYLPCGHAVSCETCAVRHVLSQLKQGKLHPHCSNGCGAKIEQVERLKNSRVPIPIYTAGKVNSGHSLVVFLENMVAENGDDASASAALEMWTDLADSRLQAAFFDAVDAGDLAQCRALRAEGASIHAEDEQQLMPLHICSQLGHIDIAQWLLSEGASIDAGANGQVAMHFACVHGELEMANWLLANGTTWASNP